MIIGFVGNKGSGKTLTMTKYAYAKQRLGYNIYSNFKLNFPFSYITIDDLMNWSRSPDLFKRCIILVDELHIWADARKSGAIFNILISTLITQTRKKGIDFLYTTQMPRTIDVRIRDMTDEVFECLSISLVWKDKGSQPIVKINYMPKGDEYKVMTWIKNKIVEFSWDGNDKVIEKTFRAEPYYDLYDTTEVIKVLDVEGYKIRQKILQKKLIKEGMSDV